MTGPVVVEATTTESFLQDWKSMLKLSDQIRFAVESGDRTAYRICADTGLDRGAMSRFLAAKRGLSMESLDKLAEYLQLKLVRPQRPKSANSSTEKLKKAKPELMAEQAPEPLDQVPLAQ